MAIVNSYTFNTPEKTDTIDKFIACQSSTEPSYYNFSFKDETYYNGIDRWLRFSTYNVISDYIYDIREEYGENYTFTDEQFLKYKYKPKLVAFDLYGCAELGPFILLLNDMYSVRQFNRKNVILITKSNMREIVNYLFNANNAAIKAYNS